jgi:ATP-binding cassette, subfamily B, bacterial
MRSDLRAVRYILRMAIRVDWRQMTVAALALLVSYLAAPLVAFGLKLLTDDALAGHVGRAEVTGVVVAALLVGELMLGHFAYFAYTELGERLEVAMTDEIMQQINGSAGIEWHERPDLADRLALLSEESFRTQLAFAAILRVAAVLVQIAATAVLLALVDWWLLLAPLAAIPLLLASRRGRDIIEAARERTAASTRLSHHLARLATQPASSKEIRVFGLQHELITRRAALWRSVTRELWRAQCSNALLQAIGQLIFAVGYCAAVYLAIRQVLHGSGSLGNVVMIVVLVWTVSSQLTLAAAQLQTVHASGRHLDRLTWLRSLTQPLPTRAVLRVLPGSPAFPRQASAADRPGAAISAEHSAAGRDRHLRRGIVLDHVSFCYPGTARQILTDLTLTLPARSTIALVGENGAGKSTLVKLLCRLYEPSSGRILLDGTDVADIPVSWLRARTSSLFQDFARLQMRLRDEVGAGDLAGLENDERLLLALAQAQAQDVGLADHGGLDGVIGHEYGPGRELSSGQWQKIGLARALMRPDPLLLVLDEPASSMDATAEHALFQRYAGSARRAAALSGAITLIVSHRFSEVRMADLIVVLADGRVTESGTHADLITNGGLYEELYALKSRAYQ